MSVWTEGVMTVCTEGVMSVWTEGVMSAVWPQLPAQSANSVSLSSWTQDWEMQSSLDTCVCFSGPSPLQKGIFVQLYHI